MRNHSFLWLPTDWMTPLSRVIFEKLICAQLIRIEGLLPRSQKPSTGSYLQPDESNLHSLHYFFSFICILILSLCLRFALRSGLFSSDFPTKTLYPFLISPIRVPGRSYHIPWFDHAVVVVTWFVVMTTQFEAWLWYYRNPESFAIGGNSQFTMWPRYKSSGQELSVGLRPASFVPPLLFPLYLRVFLQVSSAVVFCVHKLYNSSFM
jgi:hypothetical protein